MLRCVVVLCAAFLCFATRTAFAASFTASLDNGTLTLGENTSLSLTFQGGNPDQVPTPYVDGLRIDYVGPSQQMSIVNGHFSSTTTYRFTVTPQRTGAFTIPAITAVVDGQTLASQPLTLNVLKPGAPPPQAINSGSELAFMRLVLPKKKVYLGEVFTIEVQIYLRNIVQNAGQFHFTALPSDGFTVGKMTRGQQRAEQIGASVYNVTPIYIALTAIKTGDFNIGPITASLVVQLPAPNRQNNDPFDMPDPFGMFQRGVQKQLTFATDTESLQSLPLPTENIPPDFNGAIGVYNMTVNAGPTNVAVGDPITIRVNISGRGALDALTLPQQSAWHDFKVYPPTSKVKTTDDLGMEGTKSFEEIIAPQSTNINELPPFSFSFFDPNAGAYRTLKESPLPLTVEPGGATPVPIIAAAQNETQGNTLPEQNIVSIKQRAGELATIGPPVAEQTWFWAVQGVPLLAWMAALTWRKRTDTLANNPRLRRQRLVAQIIRSGLDDLRKRAAENNSDEFFATLFRLLQEQLGERLDCPASAITEAVIDEQLRPRNVPDATLSAVEELFQMCNQARYAPIRSSQELVAIVPKLETTLTQLQGLKK